MESAKVIIGPDNIYSIHKRKGFVVPAGKFAVAKWDRVLDTWGHVAVYSMLFDKKEIAEKLAKSTQVETAKDQKDIDTVFDYDPNKATDEEMILTNNDYVLSQSMDNVFNPEENEIIELSEDDEIKQNESLIKFICDNCVGHLMINIEKNKEANQYVMPCKRCHGIMFREENIE